LALTAAAFAGALAGWSPAAGQPAEAVEAMARETFDGFRVHCLANMANPKLVRDGAREMKYAPVAADLVKRLGTDEAWYVPSERGSIVLGLNAKGHCGVVAQDVDVAAFARLLEERLSVAAAVDEVVNGWRTRVYSLAYDNRTATLRLRQGADVKARGPVSLTLSDVRPMPPPPPAVARTPSATVPAPNPPIPQPTAEQAAAQRPAASQPPAPAAVPAPAAPQPTVQSAPLSAIQPAAPAALATAPPAPGGGPRVPKDTSTQVVFPGPATINAWDPEKRVIENTLTVAFADACYQTRAQPADVLTRAQQQKWKPLQASLIGGGFDFAWTTPEQPPEQVLVFYDSLKTRCCASMFGVRKLDLLTAATRRFTLAPDKAYARDGKEVLQFKARKDYRITIDFEPAGDGTSFANMCYLAR
jgi:hypothetical protein